MSALHEDRHSSAKKVSKPLAVIKQKQQLPQTSHKKPAK